MMKWILWMLLPVALLSCAGPGAGSSGMLQNEFIDSLIIRNTTNEDILNVELKVPSTGGVVEYNRILAGREHELDFPPREHERREAYLSWEQGGQKYRRQIHSLIPADLDKSRLHKVVVFVGVNGQLSAQV
ncbi:MAG: hypothetical protein AAF571_07930, partial [Verrucomicrobiota bacterium]